MKRSIKKLVEIASPHLSEEPPLLSLQPAACDHRLVSDWLQLLGSKNGFYCFESALHVFPARSSKGHIGLEEWNSSGCWRYAYAGLDRGAFFVAEDLFGDQFGLLDDSVCKFNSETGEVKKFSGSVAEWADLILSDFNAQTGYPLAHEWQTQFGALAAGRRLVPKIPFVLGGDFSIKNLYACDAVAGMKARGDLAKQLVDVPDGASIKYTVVE